MYIYIYICVFEFPPVFERKPITFFPLLAKVLCSLDCMQYAIGPASMHLWDSTTTERMGWFHVRRVFVATLRCRYLGTLGDRRVEIPLLLVIIGLCHIDISYDVFFPSCWGTKSDVSEALSHLADDYYKLDIKPKTNTNIRTYTHSVLFVVLFNSIRTICYVFTSVTYLRKNTHTHTWILIYSPWAVNIHEFSLPETCWGASNGCLDHQFPAWFPFSINHQETKDNPMAQWIPQVAGEVLEKGNQQTTTNHQ